VNNFENRNGNSPRQNTNTTGRPVSGEGRPAERRPVNPEYAAYRAGQGARVPSARGEARYRTDGRREYASRAASSRSDGYRGNERHGGYNSRSSASRGRYAYKKQNKGFTPESPILLILVSIAVAVLVIAGVVVNYIKNLNDVIPPAGDDAGVSYNSPSSAVKEAELYSLDSEEVEPEITFPLIKVFDSDGREHISPVRQKNGSVDGFNVYEYDDEGICVCKKFYGRDGKLINKDVNSGKKEGVVRTLYEAEYDDKNSFTGYTETFFDVEGTIVEKVRCSYNGVVEGKYNYEYDSEGRVKRENRYTTYGELSVYTDFSYDSFGNVTEKTQHDPSGKEVIRDVMKYDGENRMIREEHYTLGVCKSYTDYTYDSEGNANKKRYILKDEYTMTYVEADY